MTAEPTPVELMTIAGSRLLRDGRVVFAGVGAPLEASVLAKRLHAPSLTIVLEGGSIGPRMMPGKLPVSTNEMRAAHDAFMLTAITDLFLYAQRGCYDYGFIGAGQIDQYGNVNTSYIGDPDAPKVRLPGSGGANDIVSQLPRGHDHDPARAAPVRRARRLHHQPGLPQRPRGPAQGRPGAQPAGLGRAPTWRCSASTRRPGGCGSTRYSPA